MLSPRCAVREGYTHKKMEGEKEKYCDKYLAVIAAAGKKINDTQIFVYLNNASTSKEVLESLIYLHCIKYIFNSA